MSASVSEAVSVTMNMVTNMTDQRNWVSNTSMSSEVASTSAALVTPTPYTLPTVKPDPDIPFAVITEPPCSWILHSEIDNSRVRIWDLAILIPNALFLVFLVWKLRNSVGKLQSSSSPIFTAFYGLVMVVSVISVLRCIVSMTVNASVQAGDIADKMLWLILRFFLLATESSVIIFGIYFGHLDSRTSIRRVLVCTSFFALGYSITQGTLELKTTHLGFNGTTLRPDNSTENYDLFAHGGMIFLCTSSALFCLIYIILLILPLTRLRERFTLPTKRAFYYYVSTLAVLNLSQAVGSLLFYHQIQNALCVIDVTTITYFTFFAPLVYGTFLWGFFRTTQSGILFSYKHQVDDVIDEDQLSLPYQTPFAKPDTDNNAADGYTFGSTHFDRWPSRSPSGSPGHSVNSEYYHVST